MINKHINAEEINPSNGALDTEYSLEYVSN